MFNKNHHFLHIWTNFSCLFWVSHHLWYSLKATLSLVLNSTKGPGTCHINSPSAPHSTGMTQILWHSETHSDCPEVTHIIIIISIKGWAIWPVPSPVTAALASVSSVSQLFSFPVDCSGMILKGFSVVAFFAGVRASSFYIHLSCLVCIQSVVRSEWSRLSYGH
jgi:hypothetical protein